MNTKKKLALYFFDPLKSEEKYSQEFYHLSGQREYKAYSPLYLLRRHMYIVSTPSKLAPNETPYLPALLLMQIAIEGMVKGLGYPESYEDFYLKYLNKDPIQQLGIRLFRNGLEHNNYQLYSRCGRDDPHTRKQFSQLIEYFIENKKADKGELVSVDYFKVTFTLSPTESELIVEPPVIEKKYNSYFLVRILIRPFHLLERFENGIKQLHKDVACNQRILNLFDKNITIDNWMKII